MAASAEALAAGRILWTAAIDPAASLPPCDPGALRTAIARFAGFAGPTTAAWLLERLLKSSDPVLSADNVERARQLARFQRATALRWLTHIAEGGIDVVALKGFATAHRFYPDPLLRAMGDVDLLVRPDDLDRLCTMLESRGFRFRKSRGTPSWGLSSESSFHPFVSEDGTFIFDLHVAADDYPVSRGLGVAEVFARASMIEADGVPVRVPCNDHLVLLAVTNAGRDKFDAASLTSLTDLVVALARAGVTPDWERIEDHARRGGFMDPLVAAVRLLARLGIDHDRLPAGLLGGYRGPAARAFEGIAADCLSVFAEEPSRWLSQARDWLVISSLPTLAHRNRRRIRGLIRPWPGVPPGHRLGDR